MMVLILNLELELQQKLLLYHNMENFTFILDKDESNLILKALSKLPYEEVFRVIFNLQDQATRQLEENNKK